MAISKEQVVNLALSHIGIGSEVANLATENSEEAATGRRFYDISLNVCLLDFPWPFASRIASLALVETDPSDEWKYSYRYPTDCLYMRRILSGNRNDNRQTRQSYKMYSDAAGMLVFTDVQDAQIEYTITPETMPSSTDAFIMAFSFYLAHLMAPRLTAGDPNRLGARALSLYNLELSRAASRAFNEEQPDEEPQSEFIRGR
jgi:hypothetical protein